MVAYDISDSFAHEGALEHYLNGTIHEETEDLAQAALEYQLALLNDGNSSAIRVALARVYYELGNPHEAMLVLEQGWKAGIRDEELLKRLADRYLGFERRSDAADCYLDIAETRALERMELLKLAVLFSGSGRYDEALVAYYEYLDRFEPDADVYQRISLIHITRRDIAAAETTLKRLVELDSTRHEIFFILGGIAVAREDWEIAEDNFRTSLKGDSSNIKYWMNLLLVLGEQKDTEEVLTAVDEAIRRFIDIPTLYDIQGGALVELERYNEALTAMDKSIELDSSRISPYLSKGYIYHKLNQWYEGAQAYESALRIDPDSPVILNNYAYMLSEQNHRLEDGLEMVKRALELDPGTASFLDTHAWLLYRLGRPSEALIVLNRALKTSKDSAELYEHLGYIYQTLGKESKAKKAWRRAFKIEPDNEEYARLAR